MQRRTSLLRSVHPCPAGSRKTAEVNGKNASNHKKRHLPPKPGERSLNVKRDEKLVCHRTSSSSRPPGNTKLVVGKKDAHLNHELRVSRAATMKSKCPRKTSQKLVSNPPTRKVSCSGGNTKKERAESKVYHEKIVHEARTEKVSVPKIPKILVTLVESESWRSSSSTTQRRVLHSHSGDSVETQAEAIDTDEVIDSGQTSDTLDSFECFTDSQNETTSSSDSDKFDRLQFKSQECKTGGEAERGSGTGQGHFPTLNATAAPDSLYYKIKSTSLGGRSQNQHPVGSLKIPHKSGFDLIPSSTKIGALAHSSQEEFSWIGWNSANWHYQNTQPLNRWGSAGGTVDGSANKDTSNKYPLKVGNKPISNRCNSLVHKESSRNKHVFISGATQPHILVDASGENDVTKVTYMNQTQSGEEDLSESGSRAIISQATYTQTSLTVKKEVEIGAGAECHQADREPSTVGSLSTLPPFTLPEHCTQLDCLVGDDGPNIVLSPSYEAPLAGILTTEGCQEKLSLPNEEVHLQRSEAFTPEMNENGCDEDESTICDDPILMLTNSEFVKVKNSTGIAPELVQREMREDAVTIEGQIPRKRMISIRTKNLTEKQKQQILLSLSWNPSRITESLDASLYATCLERKKLLSQPNDSKMPLSKKIIPPSSAYVKQWSLSEESVHTVVELNPTYMKAIETVISPSERLITCLNKVSKSKLSAFNKGSLSPVTSINACSKTLHSSIQNEAFSTNVSAHPFRYNSHRSSRTILLSTQPISLTSVSSFESEEPIPGGRMNANRWLKEEEEEEEEGRVFDKRTTLMENTNPSQCVILGGNKVLACPQNFVEVYYDASLCMTRAGPVRSRDVSAAVNVLIDLDQNTFSVPDLDSSVVTSDVDTVTLEHDFQNAGSQKSYLRKKKKKKKCKRSYQSPQGDRQRQHASISPTPRQRHGKVAKKPFFKVQKSRQRKYQVNRLPMLNLDGISPKRIPHISKEHSSSSTDTLQGCRKVTEASKEVQCSKPLIERPAVTFHFISPRKTQSVLFEKHLAQIKRPSSWNSTIFSGPKGVVMNAKRIKKRQAMAYEKKVHQLSVARILNENNNASTRMEYPRESRRRSWESTHSLYSSGILLKLKFWGQNRGITCWNFFRPHKCHNDGQFDHKSVKFDNYEKIRKLRASQTSSLKDNYLKSFRWKYPNQKALLQPLPLSLASGLKYFTQFEEFFNASYTLSSPTTHERVQPESIDEADREKITFTYSSDFCRVERCELPPIPTSDVYNFLCFQKQGIIISKLPNDVKMKADTSPLHILLGFLCFFGIKKAWQLKVRWLLIFHPHSNALRQRGLHHDEWTTGRKTITYSINFGVISEKQKDITVVD